ncbi:S9 family peptidase [Novosphingobium sp.]|uniref:alpha/beta hydrolase family protein n=1 Tax=Novosphingobium sp. TaxID=1874826 RepID=UPI0025EA4B64|nr:S9 family peptidase [Novosphingobium sp.]MCC6927179.1 S9 family peptidase [Novosphingobium sp.]
MTKLSIALGALAIALSATPLAAQTAARTMTPQDLVTLKRVASPAVSPDGQWVVYQQTDTDPASYKRVTGLWRVAVKGGVPARIADLADASENSPAFSPDGKRLYFISGKSGSDQLWLLDLASPAAAPVQASTFKTDVAGFAISPDGQRVLVWGDVARNCPTLGCDKSGDTSQPGPGSGRHYKDGSGFVRHWDAWETPGNYSRAFAFALAADGRIAGDGVALDGPPGTLTGDTPTKPMGGSEELAWAADSRSAFFVARQADRNEPLSTDTDVWHSMLDGKAPHKASKDNRGADTLPSPSPDGQWLAWAAMARPGYEADRLSIQLMNLKTHERRTLAPAWDRSVGSIAWSPDSKALIVTAEEVLDNPVFRIELASGKVTRLKLAPKGLSEGHIGNVIPLKNGGLVFTRDAVANPAEVYVADKGKPGRTLTQANAAQLAELNPVTSTRFSFKGAGGDMVWGQIHRPAGASGKLPVLLFVHGGPQGSFNDAWSFRWNPRIFASQGYAVVSVDFHGSTGYGQAFTDSINRDWGGKPLEDLKLGLAAALATNPDLDGANSCALGASYGGYMMNWIEGQWPDRFKCLVNHNGVFDSRAMAYATEELWFDEWEHGGKPYHEAPGEYEKWNPANHVAKWQTPMLVVLGEKDFRIPYSQGLGAFTALQRKGVEAELLVFPDENHWVLKAKNSLQWHQTVFAWLGKHLKPGS